MNAMSGQYSLMTLLDTASAISSPASGAGRAPAASPECRTTSRSGPEARPANPSRSEDGGAAQRMTATSGRKWLALLHRADPLLSLSRTLLTSSAWRSTECCLIWKPLVTAHGRLLFRLVPSTRPTAATGSGSPLSTWPTPTASDHKGSNPLTRSPGDDDLPTATIRAMWSTPRASDGEKGGPNMAFGAGGTPLPAQAASGTMPDGSPGATERQGGSLSPRFVAWMQGYPPEWLECAPKRSRSSKRASPTGSPS